MRTCACWPRESQHETARPNNGRDAKHDIKALARTVVHALPVGLVRKDRLRHNRVLASVAVLYG